MVQLQHLAVEHDVASVRVDAHVLRQPRVLREVPVLAVDRHERPRPGQADHGLELLLRRVPADMHVLAARRAHVEHLAAGAVQVVDGRVHRRLVARNRAGGEHDGVAVLQAHVAVVARGHARERRHRLALRARAEDHRSLVADAAAVGDVAHAALVVPEVVEIGRDADVLFHREAGREHDPIGRGRAVEDLLDARDLGGEGGDDHAPGRGQQDLRERVAHDRFGRRRAGPVGVGRVAAEQAHAVVPVGGEPAQVRRLAHHRRVVDLEIAGMDDQAGRRVERDPEGVGDRVGHGEELDRDLPEVVAALRVDRGLRCVEQPGLVELGLDQPLRERRAVDRRRQRGQQEAERADVILVPVRDQIGPQLAPPRFQVRRVWDDVVDAVHLVGGEHQAGVGDDHVLGGLVDHHVAADVAEPAERDHAHDAGGGIVHGRSNRSARRAMAAPPPVPARRGRAARRTGPGAANSLAAPG